MANPKDDAAVVESLREVVVDAENLIESLTIAADAVEDGGYSPDLARRLRSWATVLEAPRNDAHRVVGAARGREATRGA